MGSTTYIGNTVEQALAIELSGCKVLDQSGRWYLWENQRGYVGLTYFIVRRDHGSPNIKGVDITMGPGVSPPKRLAQAYVDHHGWDNVGKYARPLLEKALRPKNTLKPGQHIVIDDSFYTLNDQPFVGEFVYLGRFRARRVDTDQLVRLPKQWKRNCTWHAI